MKIYEWHEVEDSAYSDWVPADVAQRLYDIVEGERIRYEHCPPESELEMMHRDAVLDALAAANGEET